MVRLRNTIVFLLHLDALDETFMYAKELRRRMTYAESILWKELRGRKLRGLKFRRQHALRFYIADFYCHEKRLVIEIDGGIHNKMSVKVHDDNRTAELNRLGIQVIRFSNDQVILSLKEVLSEINDYVENIQNNPPLSSRRGGRG
jgi:very-short-patch-repair endonuclease